jgi:hypothetical protein
MKLISIKENVWRTVGSNTPIVRLWTTMSAAVLKPLILKLLFFNCPLKELNKTWVQCWNFIARNKGRQHTGVARSRVVWDTVWWIKEKSYGPINVAMEWLALVVRIWEVLTWKPAAPTNGYRGFRQTYYRQFFKHNKAMVRPGGRWYQCVGCDLKIGQPKYFVLKVVSRLV